MKAANLFRALGDPTRLEMVLRLSSGDIYTITTVSNGLGITRQGARKHLQLLADANVITLEPKGRDTEVHLNRDTLERGKAFITELELRWDRRLEALRQFVERDHTDHLK
ncbi:MAG: helix-turn-helix domain-containing protein [bacterium]|nr:helix-turn-helix domain-containing protein [bacterium]